jgi:type II secretory pathway pseudopilin PulG
MTLFELIVAIALVAALAGVTLPLILSRSRTIAFDELLMQIERSGAVARSEAQRQSEALRFEARWDQKAEAYVIGMARLEELDASTEEDELSRVVRSIETMSDLEPTDPDTEVSLAGLEVLVSLPTGVLLQRTLTDEQRDVVFGQFTDHADLAMAGTSIGGAAEDPAWDASGAMEDGGEHSRFTIAIFLPDGTLIAGERLYLIREIEHFGRIESNAWLGQITAKRLDLADVQDPQDDDEPLDEEDAEPRDEGEAAPGASGETTFGGSP